MEPLATQVCDVPFDCESLENFSGFSCKNVCSEGSVEHVQHWGND